MLLGKAFFEVVFWT